MYEAPELQYVGEASKVILGVENLGGDFMGQSEDLGLEFEVD